MKEIFFLVLVLVFTNCTKSNEVTSLEGFEEHEAVLIYQLPADGCDWHFVVEIAEEVVQLVADNGTLPKVQQFIADQNEASPLEVILNYKLTGKNKEVTCGWGTTVKMKEIQVAKITKL